MAKLDLESSNLAFKPDFFFFESAFLFRGAYNVAQGRSQGGSSLYD